MSDCIEWEGSRTAGGYGRIWMKDRHVYAHRQVMADIYGWDALEGREVMHLCDNKPCVNPEHLRIGTHAENMADAAEKGLLPGSAGNRNHVKLTPRQVVAVRHMRRCGMKQQQIASFFGVSRPCIGHLLNGRTWKVA
jgi:predicted XRE-type DNA-binding protein